MALNKVKLQKDLYNCLFQAYVKQYMACNDIGMSNAVESINATILAQVTKSGHSFAKKVSTEMADAIEDFVKSMQITVTVSPPVMCGGMPVTGVISPMNVKIS
jgi:hypothetical protein